MVAQKCKKNLTNIFGLFARLLTYNSTQLKIQNYLDFSKTYGRLLENPKAWNSRELCLPENNFKIYSIANSAMTGKLNFKVFRAVFLFEVHSQQIYWKKKLLHLQDHTEQNAIIGGSGELPLSSSE